MQVCPVHLSNNPGSEETSPRTNDGAEFISSNHFSNSAGRTEQPITRFKTSAQTFFWWQIQDNASITPLHRTKQTATAGKATQTTLVNSACISLPKNVNTFNYLPFTSPRHCLHIHGMGDKITGLNSLASLYMRSSRQMFFCEDLLSYYKPCLHDDYNRDAGKAREIWS